MAGPPAIDRNRPWSELSFKERMERRFPQPARVGDLIGLPILDYSDRIMARVIDVERTASGDVRLVAAYYFWLGLRQRPVAVPIEVVGIAARQIAALDMSWDDFDRAPTWKPGEATPIPKDDKIRIALYRR
jgi:hypothetical protein